MAFAKCFERDPCTECPLVSPVPMVKGEEAVTLNIYILGAKGLDDAGAVAGRRFVDACARLRMPPEAQPGRVLQINDYRDDIANPLPGALLRVDLVLLWEMIRILDLDRGLKLLVCLAAQLG